MKIVHLLILLMSFIQNVLAAEECVIDFNKYKTLAPRDCVSCQNDINIPSDKIEKLVNPVINFVTDSNDQSVVLRRLKVLEHFLSGKSNAARCSNYKKLASDFSKEFKSYVSLCEKGPDLLDTRKPICEWVLSTYSSKVTDTFYAHWTEYGPKGEPKLIPGRYKEDLEPAIRAHESWCRMVKKNYKNKIYLDCNDVTSWVSEFNITKKVSEAMKRDMEAHEESSSSPEERRQKMFQEGCKYFEKNPATTFTKDLYLNCITSGY